MYTYLSSHMRQQKNRILQAAYFYLTATSKDLAGCELSPLLNCFGLWEDLI